MGVNQSNNKEDNVQRSYVLPVVLPADKLHSSASISTVESSSSGGNTTESSVDGFKNREAWYADREMLANLLSTYESSVVLGKGSSAQVFQVVHKLTGEKFACKIVRKSHMNDEGTMSTETEIMKRLQHDNLIQLHELYETSSSRWFIMELANAGTLQTALAEEANYTEDMVAGLFRQVLSGVQHLHDMGIVHRDLKQDNILCTVVKGADGEKRYVAKIADFGLSAVIGVNAHHNQQNQSQQEIDRASRQRKNIRQLTQMWGTKEYFAPEVYKKAYGPQVDVWSLGCVLYELLTGVPAFPHREKSVPMVKKYLMHRGKKTSRAYQLTPQWAELSAEAQDLLNMMLKVSPKKRFSIAECLNHRFIQQASASATVQTKRVTLRSSENSSKKVLTRGKVLMNAHDNAIKQAELKSRRLKVLALQVQNENAQRQ